MKYNNGKDEYKNWIVTEDSFDVNYVGKCEAIMCLGNGYLGVRSATEESYMNEVRNTFVAGTFNKADENEVTELPNVADIVSMKIKVDGEPLDITRGIVENYNRELNLKNGLLTRNFVWTSDKGNKLEFVFERVVSMSDKHTVAQKIKIIALNNDIDISIASGIDGQVTNSGAQHFSEGVKRFYEQKYLQTVFTTKESKIDFVLNTTHNFDLDGKEVSPEQLPVIDRRKAYINYKLRLSQNSKLTITKISNVFTSRDKECETFDITTIREKSLEQLKTNIQNGFDNIFKASAKAWLDEVWADKDIKIETDCDFDQLAVRFAIYHIFVMSPIHDNRMNIGAKGLSGEGYKGHTFWDTEVFLLPFFMYAKPESARSLLEYRYNCIDGARRKAIENNCKGAMYPWESAWTTDGEVTPLFGAADVVTGKAMKIWTGIIELHITSDVAFGVWQYFNITKDQDFMDKCGYEMIFETANFWQSRLEWKEENNRYEITDVIGPDEYKEHIDNNAFTNYMAHWNMQKAIEYYNELKETNKNLFDSLNTKIGLDEIYTLCSEKLDKIYLPKLTENLILPQDDTYMNLKQIDTTKYKQSDKVGIILSDYNTEQVSEMQVSKQADVLILFYLMEHLFNEDVKKANFYYYEPKCLHDSSLSLSTHSILASDIYETDLAYSLFKRATEIDLGPVMTTSDAGIHAAAFGGVWQCVINGFAGIRMVKGKLRIAPRLPQNWDSIETHFYFEGCKIKLKITQDTISLENLNSDKEISVSIGGQSYLWKNKLNFNYLGGSTPNVSLQSNCFKS